jgi:hypothetical protein
MPTPQEVYYHGLLDDSVAIRSIYRSELCEKFCGLILLQEEPRHMIWLGHKTRDGYGTFRINGKTYLAHHVAYIFWKSPLWKNQVLYRTCDNASCIFPDHHQPFTRRRWMIRCSKLKAARKKLINPQPAKEATA